jgi:hypothetical protein
MTLPSQASVAVEFDVASVVAEASAYAALIVAGDIRAAARYLTRGSAADISRILGALPHPISGSEVVSLTVPDSGRSTTITRFTGVGAPILLLAVWVGTGDELKIREQRIAGV